MLSHFSHVRLFVTPWTVAHQAPLSMGFSRQEYWNGLPCPPPEDLPDPGIEPESFMSPALGGRFFTNNATQETTHTFIYLYTRLLLWLSGKESACQCRRHKRLRFDPWVRKIKEMATHSSNLIWRISRTEEPGVSLGNSSNKNWQTFLHSISCFSHRSPLASLPSTVDADQPKHLHLVLSWTGSLKTASA